MSNFSSLTGKFRVHKDETSAAKVVKRPRDSLVCNPCRKSKLRCDKGQPCSSCVKRDEAELCSYQKPVRLTNGSSRSAAAEDRLIHLESLVKQLMQNQSSPQSRNDVTPERLAQSQESLQIHAKPVDQVRNDQIDETPYVGSTHWSAILDDIQELRVVLAGPTEHESENSTTPEVFGPGNETIFGSTNAYSLQQIISRYLPPKVEIDRNLSLYFQGETYIVPFIHTSHFQRQYREFWANPEEVNPIWLSILFSVCATASLMKGATSSPGPSSNDHLAESSNFYAAAGQCLVIGEYHRPQQYVVEALVIYAHNRNMRSLDPSREAGAILGMALRLAYEMGYHRDADSFGSFTVFEGEMRRRLWAVCKQMDLMTSFQLGLPSHICLENCDTKSPRNLTDSDFDANTQVLPDSRSENEPTNLLWFIVKDRLLGSFSKVCKDALSFNEKSEVEILELDQEIQKLHTTIPPVLRTRPISESIADSPFLIISRLFMEFIYLKSLCVLHRKYMVRGRISSTKSCVEASKKIVSQFIDVYKEFAPGGILQTQRWMLTNFTMNDFLSGIMVLCLVVHTRRKRGSHYSGIDSATEFEVLSLLEQSHTICVEKSAVSRDARRVSHAIRLILNGPRKSSHADNISSESSLMYPTPSALQYTDGSVQSVDLTSLSLQSQSHQESNDATFGLLDCLSFMGADFENMDWISFEQQPFGEDTSYMNNFTLE